MMNLKWKRTNLYRITVDDLERGEQRVYTFRELQPARSSFDVFAACSEHFHMGARVSLVRVPASGPARLLASC